MRYILNSAVLTNFGSWRYKPLSRNEAVSWLLGDTWESTIRYPETAEALSLITGIYIPIVDKTIQMHPGDEALVFRLIFPPNSRRIPQQNKGKLEINFILEHMEIGLLIMDGR